VGIFIRSAIFLRFDERLLSFYGIGVYHRNLQVTEQESLRYK